MTAIRYKDRAAVLSELADAFSEDTDREDPRCETEILRMDGHKVARLTEIHEIPPEIAAYEGPGAFHVRDMLGQLKSRRNDPQAREAARILGESFVRAYMVH